MSRPSAPAPLLVIEAATAAGSVALVCADGTTFERGVPMGGGVRDDALMPAIAALFRDATMSPAEVRTIVCGNGPGSFTSLRIAAAAAKGLAHATGAALYVVPSLAIAAATLVRQLVTTDPTSSGRIDMLVHSDAMRGERFVMQVSADKQHVRVDSPLQRMSVEQLRAYADQRGLQRIALTTAAIDDDIVIRPSADAALAVLDFATAAAVDVASWEPDYGRLAEAQVKWEAEHGTALPTGASR